MGTLVLTLLQIVLRKIQIKNIIMSYNPDDSLALTTSSRSAVTSLESRPELERRRASEIGSRINLTNRHSRMNLSETAVNLRNEERSLRMSSATVNLQESNESTVTYRSSKLQKKSVISFNNLIRKSVTSFNNMNINENENNVDDQKVELTYSDLNDAYRTQENENDECDSDEEDRRLDIRKSSLITNNRKKSSITIESRNSERRQSSRISSLAKSNSHLVRSRLENPENRKRTVSECGEETTSSSRMNFLDEEEENRAYSDTEVDNMELELVYE